MYTALGMFKQAADPGDPNATASPQALPTPDIAPVKAVGSTGPRGMGPRTNYTRVNTGAPAPTDFGKESAQRIGDTKMPTKRANDMTIASRGLSMNELALAATGDAVSKMKTASAATSPVQAAAADASVTTKQANRVADVLDYLAGTIETEALAKQAAEGSSSNVGPGHGPGQSGVTEADLSGKPTSSIVPGKGTRQPSTTAPMAPTRPTDTAGNALQTNEKEHGKVASAVFSALRKRASMAAVSSDASDAPSVSAAAGRAVPPDTMEMGQGGGSTPLDGMIGSNSAAIDATKGQAKSKAKSDVSSVFGEPALSAGHDGTLAQAFDHTGAAGVKISSPVATAVAQHLQKQASGPNPAQLAQAANRLAAGGHAATLAAQPKPLISAIQRQLANGKATMANLPKGGV